MKLYDCTVCTLLNLRYFLLEVFMYVFYISSVGVERQHDVFYACCSGGDLAPFALVETCDGKITII